MKLMINSELKHNDSIRAGVPGDEYSFPRRPIHDGPRRLEFVPCFILGPGIAAKTVSDGSTLADPHLVAAVLKRVWKRDRVIFLLTLFSPVTMLVMFRKALTRIVHRFAAGNRA